MIDDGYRLTYGGLDYLALHSHMRSSAVFSVGNQIGVGKESDILVVAAPSGKQLVLKIHRLGRISFRTVKANRDYLRNRATGSWMYLSRLAAVKEYTFMKALYDEGFTVPEPIAQNRHTIVMELIDAFPLRQINQVPDPAALYAELISMILRLAAHGLIHGDFNEFNILIKEEQQSPSAHVSGGGSSPEDLLPDDKKKLVPVLIDFPQMVSVDHSNAEMYFDRDIQCVKDFFRRRFRFTSDEPGPFFSTVLDDQARNADCKRLDVAAQASGFSKKMLKEFEALMKEIRETKQDHTETEGAEGSEDVHDEDEESDRDDDRNDGAEDEESGHDDDRNDGAEDEESGHGDGQNDGADVDDQEHVI